MTSKLEYLKKYTKKRKSAPGAASSSPVPRRARHDPGDDSDISPPRQERSVKREVAKARHDSDDSDMSLPRKGKSGKTVGKQQAAKARHDSGDDSDLSPPRKGKSGKPEVKQQAVKARHDSDNDSDMSLPRKEKGGKKDVKQQPAKARHDSDNDSDMSLPRKEKGGKKDVKQPVAKARHDSDSDSDMSLPRKEKGSKKDTAAADDDDPELMSSGLRAGLVRGSDLKEQAAKVREERKAALLAAPDEETGKGAQTVYRNRMGAKVGREEWVASQQKTKKKKLSEYPEQELEWGGGLKQKSDKADEMAELERIAAQPFARFGPDEKYLEELKGKSDWNDPMRKFQADEDEADVGKAKASAPAAPVKAKKPKCPHPPWPNRFNILPGYRWDGKVRGNGYEKKWLETKNQREHKQQERWKWLMSED